MVEDHRLQLIERAHILLGCQNEDRVAGERAADRQVKRLVSQFGTVDLPGLAEMLQRREKVQNSVFADFQVINYQLSRPAAAG